MGGPTIRTTSRNAKTLSIDQAQIQKETSISSFQLINEWSTDVRVNMIGEQAEVEKREPLFLNHIEVTF